MLYVFTYMWNLKIKIGISFMVQRIRPPMQGVKVQSLVRELDPTSYN